MKRIILYTRFLLVMLLDEKSFEVIKSGIRNFKRWYADHTSGSTTVKKQEPWITYEALDFLKSIIHKEMKVFEWGSGGSTLFFSKHCGHVSSIEHDATWGNILKKEIEDRKIANITYTISLPESFPTETDKVSRSAQYKGCGFAGYVSEIDKYPDSYFDLIIVDGRARPYCVREALLKVKKGGYLMVDNTDRRYYLEPFPELVAEKGWQKFEFLGPAPFQYAFTKTSFFRKE